MRNRILSYTILVATLAAGPLCAQVDTGAILGTVKDQSGAVVPDAKLTLTNEGTGFNVSTVAEADGSYVFRPVKIGTYSVEAEYKGFEKILRQHVTVNVQQQVVVDFTLVPGQVTQTVEVASAAPLLQTQEASVGQVVTARTINDLPLNGRNFTFLAQLAAGVTQGQEDTRGLGASGSFAADGSRPAQNNYLLDGIDNNADLVDFLNGTAYVVRPPVDAIGEFKIQTNDYSAEFGRSAGATLNATVKSGTNQFHGAAWEFFRNDVLDAANFFENASNETKGRYQQNQFGGAIGGPIKRDKVFFFGDYEGTRIRQAIPYLSTVPTGLERSSSYTNLSDLLSQGGTQGPDALGRTFPLGTVFDPATTRPVTCGVADPVTGLSALCSGGAPTAPYVRDPIFATPENIRGVTNFTTAAWTPLLNQIPAGRLDMNAINLLNLFPAPSLPGLFNNYGSNPIIRNTTNQFDVRVDANLSQKDQLFGRVSYSDVPQFIPGPFTGIADGGSFAAGDQTASSINMALSETHSFAPTLVNEARLGFNRIGTSRVQPFATDLSNIPGMFGIKDFPRFRTTAGWAPSFSPASTHWAAISICLRWNTTPRFSSRTI